MKKHAVSAQPAILLQNKREREDVQERQHAIKNSWPEKKGKNKNNNIYATTTATNNGKRRTRER